MSCEFRDEINRTGRCRDGQDKPNVKRTFYILSFLERANAMNKRMMCLGMCLILLAAIGMTGCASYPSKTGVIPGGHIDREHGKPVCGYYKNFDPAAVTLEVIPMESTNPVQTQHVLIATVKDADGKALTGRRVEWMIAEGSVGSIVEVDESGWYSTRGYKVDNKYAVSHTNDGDHVLTRGNDDPKDDVLITKGQTWCVITSPVEGTTNMVVYAPGIFNWDKHKVFVTKNWNDAAWKWPADATNPVGTPHDMEVMVMKHSDGTPIANAIVNFRIVSGPDAGFAPDKKKQTSVKTDSAGIAKVRLEQVKPVEGQNVIEMDIIRQPCGECAQPMKIATGKMTKTWVGPRIGITKTAPAQAGVGDQFNYQIAVTNPGQADATNVRVTDVLPDGIEYVSSQPAATAAGQNLQWSLGTLKSKESRQIAVTVKATRVGKFENCADVVADWDLKGRACAPTVVISPKLMLEKTGPAEVLICEPIPYTVTVKNAGDGPAVNVKITDQLPDGLKSKDGRTAMSMDAGTLEPGQSKKFSYTAMASRAGTFDNTAIATADKGLRAEAAHKVVVRQPVLTVTKTGPQKLFVGRKITYDITVGNKGDGVARDTILVDTLPAGASFVSATEGGNFENGKVTWNLGALNAGAERKVSVVITPSGIGSLKNTAMAKAMCTEASAEVTTEIAGIPAILLEVIDLEDPIEVGANETYVITVTNQGSAQDTNIKVTCTLPEEQQYVSGTGPTAASAQGQVITFAPLPTLAPKAQAVYRVVVKGVKAGDVRFKVEMISDQIKSPVNETEATNIYQ